MRTTILTYCPTAVSSLFTAHCSHLAEMHAFSSKERDTETGLSYFGARYYSSDLSIWLAVDPMSDKYPNESPYVYCGNAPILLKDPNGREKINAFGKHNKTHSDASNRYKDNVPVIHLWAHGNNKMYCCPIKTENAPKGFITH